MIWINIDDIESSRADTWQSYQPQTDDIAFLQYTSGSTSDPKGVMVTQGNLITQGYWIHEEFSYTKEDIQVIWLPYFHDLGLIFVILQPLFSGIPCMD